MFWLIVFSVEYMNSKNRHCSRATLFKTPFVIRDMLYIVYFLSKVSKVPLKDRIIISPIIIYRTSRENKVQVPNIHINIKYKQTNRGQHQHLYMKVMRSKSCFEQSKLYKQHKKTILLCV